VGGGVFFCSIIFLYRRNNNYCHPDFITMQLGTNSYVFDFSIFKECKPQKAVLFYSVLMAVG
jgi:hypothetical protein